MDTVHSKDTADLHCHTQLSDSSLSIKEVLQAASKAHVRFLAISDHNTVLSERMFDSWSSLAKTYGIILVPACEMSASHFPIGGTKDDPKDAPIEIHINLLFYRPGSSPHLDKIAAYNQNNNRPGRINSILHKLRNECGIDLGCTYVDLKNRYAKTSTSHIGRNVVAKELVRQGHAHTIQEAFSQYLNDKTGRAFVKNTFRYPPLQEVVDAAKADCALPVLCHPYSYSKLSDEVSVRELIYSFKNSLEGAPGALECEYRRYTHTQRQQIRKLAAETGLLISCGSDSHGETSNEFDNQFPAEIFFALRDAHKNYYRKNWEV